MSGSTKLWVDDTMYLVDDEVGEFIEQMRAGLETAERLVCQGTAGHQAIVEKAVELRKQLTTSEAENKRLREELEVCESCGNTTKIEGGNYLLWCKACWEKVVADNKRLREALENIANPAPMDDMHDMVTAAEQALKPEQEINR